MPLKILGPEQCGRIFAEDNFKFMLEFEKWILIQISLTLASKGPIIHITGLVQIMAEYVKTPLSESLMA